MKFKTVSLTFAVLIFFYLFIMVSISYFKRPLLTNIDAQWKRPITSLTLCFEFPTNELTNSSLYLQNDYMNITYYDGPKVDSSVYSQCKKQFF